MEFEINTNQVILRQQDQVESGEYNITECNFTFSSEYEGLTKKAVFTGENGTAYLETIIDDKCSIPSEILQISQTVEIGVYAYAVENEELLLRYSPTPERFYINQGSYKEAQNSTPPTPSEIEQLQSQITTNANDIDTLENDITDIKAEQITQNTNIQTNTNDITSLNRYITEINQDIQDLETNKADKSEIPTKTSQLINDSDFVSDANYVHTDNNFTDEDETQIQTNKNDISTLQNTKADKNEIPDVSNFITKDVDNLTNYTKTNDMNSAINTAVGTETTARQNADVNIQSQIDAITSASDVVDVVSTYQDLLDYDTTKLTDKDVIKVMQDSTHSNALSYYRWSSNQWTYVGSEGPFYTKGETDTLLTDYVKNTDYATSQKGGVVRPNNGFIVTNNGETQARNDDYATYLNRGNIVFISKGTLENVITGKGLVSNTDYATDSKGGTVKINGYFDVALTSAGQIYALDRNYNYYQNTSPNSAFISKGTLEKVIAGKDLTTKAYVDGLVGDIESILETLDVGSGV